MLLSDYGLESLTILTWIMSPLIGLTVSMVTLMRNFLLTCLLQEATLFPLLPLKMLISCMTSLLEGPVQESFILSTRLLWNGSLNVKRLSKLLPMVPAKFVAARIATEQIMNLR